MRFDAGQGGVKGQFPDRNAHTVSSQVTQTQDALTIGDDNSAHIFFRPVAQHAVNVSLIVDGDKKTTRAAVDDAKLLAGQADGRSVNDRHHFLHVLRKDAVEQTLVTILKDESRLCKWLHYVEAK